MLALPLKPAYAPVPAARVSRPALSAPGGAEAGVGSVVGVGGELQAACDLDTHPDIKSVENPPGGSVVNPKWGALAERMVMVVSLTSLAA